MKFTQFQSSEFGDSGTSEELKAHYGLTAASISQAVVQAIANRK
jgi:transketolase C-terminal domain/subunit